MKRIAIPALFLFIVVVFAAYKQKQEPQATTEKKIFPQNDLPVATAGEKILRIKNFVGSNAGN